MSLHLSRQGLLPLNPGYVRLHFPRCPLTLYRLSFRGPHLYFSNSLNLSPNLHVFYRLPKSLRFFSSSLLLLLLFYLKSFFPPKLPPPKEPSFFQGIDRSSGSWRLPPWLSGPWRRGRGCFWWGRGAVFFSLRSPVLMSNTFEWFYLSTKQCKSTFNLKWLKVM